MWRFLYGRAGHLTAKNGGFRPGQVALASAGLLVGLSSRRGLAEAFAEKKAAVALDVHAILTPACVFRSWLSIQSIKGGVRMTLTSTPRPPASLIL